MAEPIVSAHGPPPTGLGKAELDTMIVKGRADPTAIQTLRCPTVASGRPHQLNYIRDLPPQPVMEDEPGSLSSETSPPMPLEALLEAQGSRLAVDIHRKCFGPGVPIRVLGLTFSTDISTDG